LRIGFSARGLTTPSGGVHEFIRALAPALAACRGDDELYVFYSDRRFLGLAPGAEEIVLPDASKLWWDFVRLPRRLRKLKLDAAIFPKNVVPYASGCATFAVVHDLAYFLPELNAYPLADTVYMRAMMRSSARRATGLFAVSEHTRRDIVRFLGRDASDVIVTHEAVDPMFRPDVDADTLRTCREAYDLPEKFILYTGSLSPRKNLPRLLEAMALLGDCVEHKLTLTGSKSWKDKPVFDQIRRLKLEGRVHRIGYVDRRHMPALYRLSDLYVYPSLYEGFGLPVLEAMRCGRPVVASRATSIPEVAGDAALLVDPEDPRDLAAAMHLALTDVSVRERLIQSGLQQASGFSWTRCAQTMLDAIRRYGGRGMGPARGES
jgi:glycosyltransferase involved in cell wall biosynthesis